MIDREKVIEALETCRDQNNPPGYRFTSCVDDCPYYGNGCARKLKEDALAMLKEQQQRIEARWINVPHKRARICSHCEADEPYKFADDDADVYDFCPHCGAKMEGR